MKNTKHYYNSCPNCGANLDPGERCDCQVITVKDRCVCCHTYVPEGKHVCLVCSTELANSDNIYQPLRFDNKVVKHRK